MGVFGPKPQKIVERGTTFHGVLTGIRYRYVGSDPEVRVDSFAIRAGGRTYGVRQHFTQPDHVRLGMAVIVRELGGHVVIDMRATMAPLGLPAETDLDGWKPVKEPHADGIVDDEVVKATKKGARGEFVVTAFYRRDVLFGLSSSWALDGVVTLPDVDAYEVTIGNAGAPSYATHLPAPGTSLVCVVGRRLDKPHIDWAASAERRPGVGVPPVDAFLSRADRDSDAISASVVPVEQQVADVAGDGATIGGISLVTFARVMAGLQRDRVRPGDAATYAQRYGVPPDAWPAAEAGWNDRMRSDWRVGAAFGETFQAARSERSPT